MIMARLGRVNDAPMNRARLWCRIFFRIETCTRGVHRALVQCCTPVLPHTSCLNFSRSRSEVVSSRQNLLTATWPCQWPRNTSPSGPRPTRSTSRTSSYGMLHSSTLLRCCRAGREGCSKWEGEGRGRGREGGGGGKGEGERRGEGVRTYHHPVVIRKILRVVVSIRVHVIIL